MLLFEWASRIETVGFKLGEGKDLREGWDSKELWKSVERIKGPHAMPAPSNSILSVELGPLEVPREIALRLYVRAGRRKIFQKSLPIPANVRIGVIRCDCCCPFGDISRPSREQNERRIARAG